MNTAIIDGNFDYPVEIEGSPMVSIDAVTLSILVTRKYVVGRSAYRPSYSGLSDPIFAGALFIDETGVSESGPLYFFDRHFASIPNPRTELREVPFTHPGQPAVVISKISSLPIGWNQYGLAAPYTRLVVANVDFSYQIGPFFPTTNLTEITYKGAPVDYYGDVYVQGGYVTVGFLGNNIPEQRWIFAGTTTPAGLGGSWIQNVTISRWRGPIWQKEIVSIPNP